MVEAKAGGGGGGDGDSDGSGGGGGGHSIGRRCWELALGGGIGQWLKMQQQRWAVPVAEEHVTIVLASALSKPRAHY